MSPFFCTPAEWNVVVVFVFTCLCRHCQSSPSCSVQASLLQLRVLDCLSVSGFQGLSALQVSVWTSSDLPPASTAQTLILQILQMPLCSCHFLFNLPSEYFLYHVVLVSSLKRISPRYSPRAVKPWIHRPRKNTPLLCVWGGGAFFYLLWWGRSWWITLHHLCVSGCRPKASRKQVCERRQNKSSL